jgi:hypothetical protein
MTKLQSEWVVGFTDGEGTFYVGINRQPEMTAGFQVLPEFRIVQHERDIKLLHAIKNFFNCGVVRKNHGDRFELRIRKIEHLMEIIVPFFEKYPLHTQKKFDFLSFRKIILKMQKGEHLNRDGIKKILNIAKKMNRQEKSITEENFNRIKI